jgi:hypothetical protein
MKQRTTPSERILLAVGGVIMAAWCLLVLTLSLGFQGATSAWTWAVRIVLLVAGALVTAVFVHGGSRAWQKAISIPLPGGRVSRWLARQSGWRLAIGFWLVYSAPEVATSLWLSRGRMSAPTAPRPGYLVVSVLGAALLALVFRTLWQRQLENSALAEIPGSQP